MVGKVLNHVTSFNPTGDAANRAANNEIKKLRGMILTVQPPEDQHSESQILRLFENLQQNIKQIPKQYYPIVNNSNQRLHSNDSDTCLCSTIGRWLSHNIIGEPRNPISLFGLRPELEDSLRQVEQEALRCGRGLPRPLDL
jgi:hypothetical protein